MCGTSFACMALCCSQRLALLVRRVASGCVCWHPLCSVPTTDTHTHTHQLITLLNHVVIVATTWKTTLMLLLLLPSTSATTGNDGRTNWKLDFSHSLRNHVSTLRTEEKTNNTKTKRSWAERKKNARWKIALLTQRVTRTHIIIMCHALEAVHEHTRALWLISESLCLPDAKLCAN